MSLLTTKLYIPPIRPDPSTGLRASLVPRPRLIERLNEGLLRQEGGFARKLTLISAPAGFGKTTLLSAWTQQCAAPVAWISLDKGDNDPVRFWAYVIAALQTIHNDVGASVPVALQSPQPPLMEGLLTGLINEIAQVADSFALVLDDFHVITHQPIHDGLTFLLNNVPPSMHLVLSSRADPPWPLARLRARRAMAELRARDLRFTSTEAASFLNEVMRLDLSPEEVATLEERTEGWIVGLQMAALSMQGRNDVAGFIRAFSGSHRYILDYLVEEVLNQQSRNVQEFLLKTSILDRMTAPLCNAVMGGERELPASQSETCGERESLTHLERANLFLVPLDDERRWYRYHHLFADLLRNRLGQRYPDQVPALHRRASAWYESQGQIVEAVGYALAAGDVTLIERLVAENALAVIYHGELATVVRWLDALPDDVMRARPRLCVTYAWTLAYAGHLDRVEPLLHDAEKALTEPEGHIAAIRAYVAALKGDIIHAAELAHEALDRLPETDLTARSWTALVLGCALRSQGDITAAAQAFIEALAISRVAGDVHLSLDVLWEQAMLQLWRGQLHKVMRSCEEAVQLADQYTQQVGQRLPVTGYLYSLMGCVLCEWNDLETALCYAREGLELCKWWGQADALIQAYFYLAKVLLAVGDTDCALNAIQEATPVARDLGLWYAITAGAYEARIRLAQGDVATAVRWMQESGLNVDGELNLECGIGYLVLTRILMTQGRREDALGLLTRLLSIVEAAGATRSVIGILVLQALALQAQGEEDQALAALERALSLAEPEGYVRVFISEGAPMGQLLRQAAVRGIKLDYVSKLLAALDNEVTGGQRISPSAPSSLIEPLSERETEVLRLLTTHLSSTEIARELFVAVSTVRSHIKNVYAKLDVHSRGEAVERAQDLGLL